MKDGYDTEIDVRLLLDRFKARTQLIEHFNNNHGRSGIVQSNSRL